MPEIVKVKLAHYGTEIHCNTHGMRVLRGDRYIVKTEKGLTEGVIVSDPVRLPKEKFSFSKRAIVAPVTPQNLERLEQVRAEEKRSLSLAATRVRERELRMKMVRVIYQLDLKKATFYFTADGRIDFRGLVKDLATALKVRVEMRQVGVRDEARMMGGVGPCGLELCCNAFLDDFEPVSIKMAKEQDLSLNPTKISGICGRLLCCLGYEYKEYEAVRRQMPRCGRKVKLKSGAEVKIKKYHILRRTAVVEGEDGKTSEVSFDDMEGINCPPGGCRGESGTEGETGETAETTPGEAQVDAPDMESATGGVTGEADGRE